MTRFPLLLLLLCAVGCASATERDTQANCSPDFEPMARGVVSCEELGDQCAYSRDGLTGVASPTTLGAADMRWLCTCGGHSDSSIKLYWCVDVWDGKATKH